MSYESMNSTAALHEDFGMAGARHELIGISVGVGEIGGQPRGYLHCKLRWRRSHCTTTVQTQHAKEQQNRQYHAHYPGMHVLHGIIKTVNINSSLSLYSHSLQSTLP